MNITDQRFAITCSGNCRNRSQRRHRRSAGWINQIQWSTTSVVPDNCSVDRCGWNQDSFFWSHEKLERVEAVQSACGYKKGAIDNGDGCC